MQQEDANKKHSGQFLIGNKLLTFLHVQLSCCTLTKNGIMAALTNDKCAFTNCAISPYN